MTERPKEKDIADAILEPISAALQHLGFKQYKPKQFVKPKEDVLLFFQLFPNKNNVYLWCAVYPLCQNDIWFGAGAVAERFPEMEGALKVVDSDSLSRAVNSIANKLPDIIQYLDNRSTLEKLEKSIPNDAKAFPLLVKAFCLSGLGYNDEAKPFLKKFIDSGVDLRESRSGAEKLLASINAGDSSEILEENRANNIKKLRLKKFI